MNSPMIGLAIDTETTGNMPKVDGVCQLGAVALVIEGDDIEIKTVMSTLCVPSIAIKEEAIAVHGITDDMLTWAPDEHTALQTLVAEILYLEKQGYDVVVGGHGSERFDFPIINRILGKESIFHNLYRFDSLMMARRWFPDAEHKLGPLYEWFVGKPAIDAHDATADCWMVCEILRSLLRKKDTLSSMTPRDALLWMAQWCETPYCYEFMPFGKHKGMAVDEIPTTYFGWMQNNFKEPDMDMDYTINKVLEARRKKDAVA